MAPLTRDESVLHRNLWYSVTNAVVAHIIAGIVPSDLLLASLRHTLSRGQAHENAGAFTYSVESRGELRKMLSCGEVSGFVIRAFIISSLKP